MNSAGEWKTKCLLCGRQDQNEWLYREMLSVFLVLLCSCSIFTFSCFFFCLWLFSLFTQPPFLFCFFNNITCKVTTIFSYLPNGETVTSACRKKKSDLENEQFDQKKLMLTNSTVKVNLESSASNSKCGFHAFFLFFKIFIQKLAKVPRKRKHNSEKCLACFLSTENKRESLQSITKACLNQRRVAFHLSKITTIRNFRTEDRRGKICHKETFH